MEEERHLHPAHRSQSGPAQAQRSLEDMREILGEDEDDTAAVPDDKEGESAGEEEVEEENTVYITEVAPGNEYVEQVLCTAHMEAEKKPTPLTIQMNLRVSFKELLDSHVKVFADREMTKSLPIQRLETSLTITAKALRNFSKSKMFSKMPVTEPWGKEKKTSFQALKESMHVIKYDELDPQLAKLDIACLIFSYHKGIPGMYQFRRQMDRNIAKGYEGAVDKGYEGAVDNGYEGAVGKGYEGAVGKGYEGAVGKGYEGAVRHIEALL
eukprot:g50424.t1